MQAEGLDYLYWEHVTGSDANVHLAILSRFPFSARRPHTDDNFELGGQRFRVRRGFAEVDVQVNPDCQFTLLAAHLKSKNAVPDVDAAALRLEEAKLLRSKVDARLAINADAKLIVLGDFNDTEDSAVLKIIRGNGEGELFDTRPSERGADANLEPSRETRTLPVQPLQSRWPSQFSRRNNRFKQLCKPEPIATMCSNKSGPTLSNL